MILPPPGTHDTAHLPAIDRRLLLQRERRHLLLAGPDRRRRRSAPQEVPLGTIRACETNQETDRVRVRMDPRRVHLLRMIKTTLVGVVDLTSKGLRCG